MKLLVLLILTLLTNNSFAKVIIPYNKLALRDLDEVNEYVRLKISESKKQPTDGRQIILKETLFVVFSRPDEDGLISKVLPDLSSELDKNEILESAYSDLINESIEALKNPEKDSSQDLVTHLVFLENIISEFKPKLDENFNFEMIKKIAQSDFKVPKKANNERKVRMMKARKSPSEIAAKVIAESKKKKSEPTDVDSSIPEIESGSK